MRSAILSVVILVAIPLSAVASAVGVERLRQEATGGDAAAQYALGWMYLEGTNVTKNTELGIEWVRKAADQGNAKAQCCMGGAYHFGEGVPQDDMKALSWYRKAAEQRWAAGQLGVGLAYRDGLHVSARGISWNQIHLID